MRRNTGFDKPGVQPRLTSDEMTICVFFSHINDLFEGHKASRSVVSVRIGLRVLLMLSLPNQ